MDSCDVLIVGGGPAGSSCAWRLRRAGLDVVVIDRASFPRDKPCAGWITPAVIETLQIDVEDYRRGRVFQPITGFRTCRMGGPEVESCYGRPISFGILRREFDHYLLLRSAARLRLGVGLEGLRREGRGWVVNEAIRAPVVVGAGGHFCPVARHLGARPGSDELAVAAQEVEFAMDARQRGACTVDPELPELFFCKGLDGYGWCFRKGDVLNVGLGRLGAKRIGPEVDAFCDALRKIGKLPREVPAKFRGHAYLLNDRSPRRVLDDGIILVGDAAGLAYPQSGEGIRPAVESGLMAAGVILSAGGSYAKGHLEPYARELAARFGRLAPRGPDGRLSAGLKRLVGGPLLSSSWFARKVVMERWFLHVHEAPLAIG